MDKLPDEILCRILQEMYVKASVREVILVNRRFARIATPLLYESVVLENCSDFETPGKLLKATRRFLDTLVTSPHLGSDVRVLSVEDWQSVDVYEKNVDVAPASLADLSKILQAIPTLASYPLDWQRKFGCDLLHSLPDALVAAILSLLPKLQSLYLTTNQRYRLYDDRGTDTLKAFTETDFNETLTMKLVELSTTPAMATTPLFACLSKVMIINDVRGEEHKEISVWDTNLISFFLRLPALETFVGSGFRDMSSESTWVCNDRASLVTTMQLEDCKIGADSLRKILRSCKGLKKFNCSRLCRDCLGEEVECNYSYAGVHDDLYQHRDSLHCLGLSSKSCSHSNIRDVEPIETLAALQKLKYLIIDEDVLFGANIPTTRPIGAFMPADLERLTISGEIDYAQHDLYREIAQYLLSSENPPSIYLHLAYVEEAEEILNEFPGIIVEDKKSGGYAANEFPGLYNFYISRVEADQVA